MRRLCARDNRERWSRGLLRGDSFVTVVKTADFRDHDDGSDGGLSGGPVIGRVFLKCEVRSTPVIVPDVAGEDAPKVRFVQDDHVIEAPNECGTSLRQLWGGTVQAR